jgi:hypothetical protein
LVSRAQSRQEGDPAANHLPRFGTIYFLTGWPLFAQSRHISMNAGLSKQSAVVQ